MPVSLVQAVNFGTSKQHATGSTGVGYTIVDSAGAIVVARTTTGVYETVSGAYAALVTYPDSFHGSINWDTGTAFLTASVATEPYNVESNDPKVADTWSMVNSVTGSIALIRNLTEGRWRIVGNQMLFYQSDNVTLVATFNLFDSAGNPTMDAVFERRRV